MLRRHVKARQLLLPHSALGEDQMLAAILLPLQQLDTADCRSAMPAAGNLLIYEALEAGVDVPAWLKDDLARRGLTY